ncbi:MAG: transposase, partial [Cetobacterium sp.]|nr:transposase [Cetobacterium sp.]
MSKITNEQRLEIYQKRKQGHTLPSLSKEYGIRADNISYLVRLIELHGEGILRREKNNYYSHDLKIKIINKVLVDKQSITSTAIEYGLISDGILHNWIKSYKENGYNVLEKKKGKSPNMKKINKNKKFKKKNKTRYIKFKKKKRKKTPQILKKK